MPGGAFSPTILDYARHAKSFYGRRYAELGRRLRAMLRRRYFVYSQAFYFAYGSILRYYASRCLQARRSHHYLRTRYSFAPYDYEKRPFRLLPHDMHAAASSPLPSIAHDDDDAPSRLDASAMPGLYRLAMPKMHGHNTHARYGAAIQRWSMARCFLTLARLLMSGISAPDDFQCSRTRQHT